MALFTLILEYRGGTYASQVAAASPTKALRAWADKLDGQAVQSLGRKRTHALVKATRGGAEAPLSLEGIANVWCWSVVVGGALALVNMVKTAPRARRANK